MPYFLGGCLSGKVPSSSRSDQLPFHLDAYFLFVTSDCMIPSHAQYISQGMI
jgi:hypothetical protein